MAAQMEPTLRVEVAEALIPAADEILPSTSGACGVTVAIVPISTAVEPPAAGSGRPLLRLGGIGAWIGYASDHILLRCERGRCGGTLDLAGGHGRVALPDTAESACLEPLLVLARALLAARAGRALVHAAAVVAPTGEAWLLPGDSHAGKSSTCATLMAAGWDYLSDDQVVLSGSPAGAVQARGEPRPFQLDVGWRAGAPRGRREVVEACTLGDGSPGGQATVAGCIFPYVEPEQPTRLEPIAAAECFWRLVRQSPWILADRRSAPGLRDLLVRVSRLPAYRLRLGLDSFGMSDRIPEILGAALGAPETRDVCSR